MKAKEHTEGGGPFGRHTKGGSKDNAQGNGIIDVGQGNTLRRNGTNRTLAWTACVTRMTTAPCTPTRRRRSQLATSRTAGRLGGDMAALEGPARVADVCSSNRKRESVPLLDHSKDSQNVDTGGSIRLLQDKQAEVQPSSVLNDQLLELTIGSDAGENVLNENLAPRTPL